MFFPKKVIWGKTDKKKKEASNTFALLCADLMTCLKT
jgi:hypothetical protein